jgi:hypothetical protein
MILLIQAYVVLALLLAVLGLETPLAKALRQRLVDLADRLFTRRTLRIALAIMTLVLAVALASGQPWLIGMTGATDLAFYFDAALISLAVAAAGVLKTAFDGLMQLRPWRVPVRMFRAFRSRQRRAPRPLPPPSSGSDDAEPWGVFPLPLAA